MIRVSLRMGAVMMIAAAVQAQRPDDGPDRPEGPPRGLAGPPGFHLMTALDADQNGKLSAPEIEQAAVALQQLDKDQDGKLSPQEIGWPPSFAGGGGFPGLGGGGFPDPGGGRGRGRGGFPGPGGGGFPGFGGQAGGRPQRPNPDSDASPPSGEQRTGGGRGLRSFFSRDQLQSLDRNDDGQITKDEVPELMQEGILSRVDTNQDGVIDKEELAKLAQPQDERP